MSYDLTFARAGQQKLWDYLHARSREVFVQLLEAFMQHERDRFLGCLPSQRTSARRGYRNGYQRRHVQTRWGLLRLRKPRVRGCAERFETRLLDRYRRRCRDVDACVRQWVAGGLATRKVQRIFAGAFDGVLSPGGVSRIVARLDGAVRSFHTRPLRQGYRYVFFDAKHAYTCHRRKRRGRGKKRKGAMLLAWGIRHDGREELIDFRAAPAEDGASWTSFLTDLEARGLKEQDPWARRLEMIVSDGDAALAEALWTVYPSIPKQRCLFHKVQDIAGHLADRSHRASILAGAAAIYRKLRTHAQGRHRLDRWVETWREREPDAVRTFCYDFELTLTYLNAPPVWRGRIRTSNPIERFIRELNRKYAQVGIFPSSRSWERCTLLVWQQLQDDGYAPSTPKPPPKTFTHTT